MSGVVNISGISQFPNPPIIIGITRKKIMIKAWAVTIVLYNWSDPKKGPGWPSSTRMRRDREVPTIPDHLANIP